MVVCGPCQGGDSAGTGCCLASVSAISSETLALDAAWPQSVQSVQKHWHWMLPGLSQCNQFRNIGTGCCLASVSAISSETLALDTAWPQSVQSVQKHWHWMLPGLSQCNQFRNIGSWKSASCMYVDQTASGIPAVKSENETNDPLVQGVHHSSPDDNLLNYQQKSTHCKKKKGSFDPYLVTAVSHIIGQFQKNYPAMTFLRLWNVYVVY